MPDNLLMLKGKIYFNKHEYTMDQEL